MSINHYIQTQIPFDFEKLHEVFSKNAPAISFEQRNENLCYFWQNNNSTRGVDVIFENGLIELRNMLMSSYTDYQITKFLASIICDTFKGETFVEFEDDEDDDDESLKLVSISKSLFNDEEIEKKQLEDVGVIRAIIMQSSNYITIYGPIRKVHFGVDFMNTYKDKTNEELLTIMQDLIKKVNYQVPNYEYGNVMETGDGENTKILKLITNQVDCMIDKYDYILFGKNENELIAIDNDTLNTILPNSWQRLDEYTIVAPMLSENEFTELIVKADRLNQFEELRN